MRRIFKPRFTLYNTVNAKNLAKSSIDAEILAGHHRQKHDIHRIQVTI